MVLVEWDYSGWICSGVEVSTSRRSDRSRASGVDPTEKQGLQLLSGELRLSGNHPTYDWSYATR